MQNDWRQTEDKQDLLVFEGEFTPPLEPVGSRTLPIAGEGTVELGDHVMTLKGREMKSGRGCVFTAMMAAAIGFCIVLVIALDLRRPWLDVVSLAVLAGFFTLAPRLFPDAAQPGTSQEFHIPYSVIDEVTTVAECHSRTKAVGAPAQAVVVIVRKFERGGIEGEREFYFLPEGGPAMMRSQLDWRT